MPWVRSVRRLPFAVAVLALCAREVPAAPADATDLLLADVEINGLSQGVALLARDTDARLLATAETLSAWRLPLPDAAPLDVRGELFYPVAGLSGLHAELDQSRMLVTLEVPPELFSDTRRSLSSFVAGPVSRESPGAFLDYDISYTRDSSPDERSLAGLLKPTVFTRRGSLSTGLLYNSQGYAFGVSDRGWRRLDTTWSYDDPARMRTMRAGDAVTNGLSWARSLRFGGFQIASNFATRPDEITFPQPSIDGTAAVPTTLDIYVNGLMRSQIDVPGGTFRINDIPVVTGAGFVQVVARDLLGREQIISKEFYASEHLLRPGLDEYSLSIGRLRENFALSSNDYGDAMLSGVWRRGLSERLTVGGQLQATGSGRVVGSSMALSFSRLGLLSAAVARSSTNAHGSLWLLAHQYQGSRYRADVRIQGTTAGFAQPGVEFAEAFPERQIALSGGVGLLQQGSVGVSLIRERYFERHDRNITSLSYSRALPAAFILSVSISHVDQERAFTESNLTLTRSLGPRASTSISETRRADGRRSRIDHRYELPTGPGYGYRTSVERGSQSITDAEFQVNTEFARYGAEFKRVEGSRALRVQSRGSVAHFGGGWFAAREISDGFAVVDAGGFENVRIYLENRPVGTTRRDGRLLVPGLRPYESNRLRLDTADIPLTVRIEATSLAISPFFRSGAIASFGVTSSSSVTLRAILPDGTPVPEGARARRDDGAFGVPVGLSGRLYLDTVADGDTIEILTRGQICVIDLDGAPLRDGLTDLGEQICDPESSASGAQEDHGR